MALPLAIVITFCLASLGELVLRRGSRTLAEWNMSFLVGLSLTSTAFIPLSWILRGYALNAIAGALVLFGAAGGVRKVSAIVKRSGDGARIVPSGIMQSLTGKVLMALLVFATVQFAVENYRLTYLWDGYQIWATKALVIYERGDLTQNLLTPHQRDIVALPNCCDGTERLVPYPQTISLFEALLAKSEGGFSWEAVKAIFPIFFVSLLVSTFQAARAFVSPVPALAASVLLALLPQVDARQSIGGYADMPQAAFAAGFLAALFGRDDGASPSYRRAAPWLLGGILMVKNEGVILFSVICAALAVAWAFRGMETFVSTLRKYAGAITVVAGCAAMRALYLAWMDTKDLTYGPIDSAHLVQAYGRLWAVPAACFHYMFNPVEWGAFWPAFFLSIAIVIWMGDRTERALCGATIASLALYTSIFYFTNWNYNLHIDQAYNRLLVQVSPAAAVLIVIAYQSIAGRITPDKVEHVDMRGFTDKDLQDATIQFVSSFEAAFENKDELEDWSNRHGVIEAHRRIKTLLKDRGV